MVSHVLWFIPDRYAGVLKDTCRASFSCVLVSRRTLKTPGLSISRIFTEEGPPVFLRLSHSEVNPASAGRMVQTADVVVILHQFVNRAFRSKFDYTVGHGLDELMVVAAEEYVALESGKVVVERLDAFEVEVVRRCVEDKAVCVLQLHARYHTAHFLASTEHVYFFHFVQQRTGRNSKKA